METHIVVGLRLEGMQRMGYIWARVDTPPSNRTNQLWHDVSVVGLRDDVPVPFIGFPQRNAKMGSRVGIVRRDSMITNTKKNGVNGVNGFHGMTEWG
jgi:hypothetical protein